MEDIQRDLVAKFQQNHFKHNSAFLNNINILVCRYLDNQSDFIIRRTTAYSSFIEADLLKWQSIYLKDVENHRLDGHLFNVFSLWNKLVRITEPIHSKLFSFLLSKNSLHGQGNTFLHLFLKQLNIINPEQYVESNNFLQAKK